MQLRSLVRRAVRQIRFDPQIAAYHFIHIPKNAGQSVRDALYLERDISLSSPYHYRYIDIADQVGKHLKFFAVIRNPWSRTASRFLYGKQNSIRWGKDDPRRKYMSQATFADFVREQRILPIPRHPGRPWMGPLSSWLNQLEWIRNEKGEVACSCLRLECLHEDLKAFLDRQIDVRRVNTTRASYDYRSMYTDELIEVVARTFTDDIEYFGFTFDGSASRNFYTR